MIKHEDTEAPETGLPHSPEALVERYGALLDNTTLTHAQKQEFLAALWQIMVGFVDLGFSLRPGDKLTPKCDLRVDDVLNCLHLEETAHETDASEKPNKNKEHLP